MIAKLKKIELENRFKKSSATIEVAVMSTVQEYAMEDMLLQPRKPDSYYYQIPDSLRNEMNETFSSKLRIGHVYKLKTFSTGEDALSHQANLKPIYSYESGTEILPLFVYNLNQKYILIDGTSVSLMQFQMHGLYDGIKVIFDTNGPFKGPNRFGYDIFVYNTGFWNNTLCSDIFNAMMSVYGCYKYAQQNKNPQDSSKKYWDSLKL